MYFGGLLNRLHVFCRPEQSFRTNVLLARHVCMVMLTLWSRYENHGQYDCGWWFNWPAGPQGTQGSVARPHTLMNSSMLVGIHRRPEIHPTNMLIERGDACGPARSSPVAPGSSRLQDRPRNVIELAPSCINVLGRSHSYKKHENDKITEWNGTRRSYSPPRDGAATDRIQAKHCRIRFSRNLITQVKNEIKRFKIATLITAWRSQVQPYMDRRNRLGKTLPGGL